MNEQERKTMYRKTFNTVAEGYDNPATRFFPESAGHLVSYLGLRGDEHVLDVATGTGNAALEISRHLPRGQVTGIDFSEGMLSRAMAKSSALGCRNVSFKEMDMQSIEFPENHFDAAVCAFSIFFVDDMEGQLRHIAGKVKHGGHVAITSFHETTFLPLIEMFLDRLRSYGVEIPPMTWKRIATEDRCEFLFEGAGLGDVRVYRKNVGYYLRDADEWWGLIWNAGYRGLVSQLSPDDMVKFRTEHLEEVEAHSSDNGIWLDVEVLFSMGTKQQS